MDTLLKKYGNRLAWATLGVQGTIAALHLFIQHYAPLLWCIPAHAGSTRLLCGFGNASLGYLGVLGLLVLLDGLCFVLASIALYLGGVRRLGWAVYLLSAVVMFVTLIAVVVSSGELNEL